jgi:hypothetical protein
LPDAHTLHVLEEPTEAEPSGESVISMDLVLAFPFVVQVNKVQDLTIDNELNKYQKLYEHTYGYYGELRIRYQNPKGNNFAVPGCQLQFLSGE